MNRWRHTSLVFALGASAAVGLAQAAHAGAFGLREQSAAAMGMAFAGAAAGAGGLGTMFWNPATITQSPGLQFESDLSLIIPYANITQGAGSSPLYLPPRSALIQGQGDSGDIGQDAILPATYASYQINDRLWLGLSVNTPYGLTTKADSSWAGRVYGSTTRVVSFDATPTLGYKVNDWLSIGAGVQIMYLKVKYSSAVPSLRPPAPVSSWPVAGLEGDSTGFGYTLGATFTPLKGTEIGIGFRSAVSQGLEGSFFGGGALGAGLGVPAARATALLDRPIKVNVVLPETVTIGLRQAVTEQFTAMLGFEWTNWSRLGFPRVEDTTTGALHRTTPYLPLDYRDGWFVSAGGEYKINAAWTARAGLAYEQSPVETDTRSVRLPDNNRIWATLGASYAWNDRLSFDVGYAHIFTQPTRIDIVPGNPQYSSGLALAGLGNLVGSVNAHVDIISVGLKYRWDEPSKPDPLIRKF